MTVTCRRQLERANAEEEQMAAEALQQTQAERKRDQDINFQLALQAEEVKVSSCYVHAFDDSRRHSCCLLPVSTAATIDVWMHWLVEWLLVPS